MEEKITITAEAAGLALSKTVFPIQDSVYKEQINTCKNSLIGEFAERGIPRDKVKFTIS